ncbi:hypothetical protein [Burkholderia gladioli]|uniref:hypothetical protein n=1 Tax=Burkholderia gladioli TaxID=28095 RepID=UPI0016422EDD|nr:hypothetical protein [Burkholderia gladioli]
MRSHTFKPGDIAIITRCGNQRYIGALVRIEKPDVSSAFDWIVEFLAGPVDGHELFTGKAGKFTQAPVWTWNLTPLADDEPESIDEQEVEHA